MPEWKTIFSDKLIDVKDSEVRDHLSNERTLLSWYRTGLPIAGLGVLIIRLSDSKDHHALGIMFVIIGLIFVAFGITRFTHVRYRLLQGKFPTMGLTMLILSLIILVSLLVTLIVLWSK